VPAAAEAPREARRPSTPVHEAAVVGSGFGGIAAVIELARQGVNDVVVLEKATDLGGTWRDNRYPGCACDIPSHLYSYSFAPSVRWSRAFAPQQEIWSYLRQVADRFDVTPRIRYGEELVDARYDDGTWHLVTARGSRLAARSLVLATGALNEPAVPALPGLESFRGTVFHSAQWPDDDHDVIDGRRVAVIGTGASAVQVVPAVARRTAHLTVMQRTPSWLIPKGDRSIGPAERFLLGRFPALARAVRAGVYWRLEARAPAFTRYPQAMRAIELLSRLQLRRQVADPRTRAALTPAYRMGCKRILPSNDYLPTFNRPDVTLVTSAVARFEPDAVITEDGGRHDVDTVVLCTGFRATDPFERLSITGADRLSLREAWRDGMQAHLGVTVAGFPNLFLVVGPNSALGHSSMVFMIEAQARYLAQCIALRDRVAARAIVVRPEVQDSFNERLHQLSSRTVWATGCRSWYLDRSGTNRALWPTSSIDYWRRTRRPRLEDFELLDVGGARSASAPASMPDAHGAAPT
jgi:cation diffusion facilitator CzcD-associated flavoprotein CzcO